jgi:hypothetical protein
VVVVVAVGVVVAVVVAFSKLVFKNKSKLKSFRGQSL